MGDREAGFHLVISYPDTPPSLNSVGSRGGPMAFHRVKKQWQEYFELLLMQTGFPRDWLEMKATARLRFPTKHRRDEGNYRTLIEKALGDALVNGGWLPDDTPDHFLFDRVHFEQQTGKPQTTIELDAK